jgi:hypothetical protein
MLLLVILPASRKLCHYFQADCVTMVTLYLLERALRNRKATGCIAEWALDLSEFSLHFVQSEAIKYSALSELLLEWTNSPFEEREAMASLPGGNDSSSWIIYFDGSYSYEGAGVGVIIVSPSGSKSSTWFRCFLIGSCPLTQVRMPDWTFSSWVET